MVIVGVDISLLSESISACRTVQKIKNCFHLFKSFCKAKQILSVQMRGDLVYGTCYISIALN